MNAQTASGALPAHNWRTHCQVNGYSIGGTSQARRRLERLEADLVETLCQRDLPIEARAVALRAIIELRGCTARELGNYFGVEPAVIIRGLSLLTHPGQGDAAAA